MPAADAVVIGFAFGISTLQFIYISAQVVETLNDVIDFIDLHVWPVFNVADMSICIGIGLLVLLSLKRKKVYGTA